MKIETSFVVPGEVSQVWQAMADVRKVVGWAGCTGLTGPDRGRVHGRLPVAIGSSSMTYVGDVRLVERDDVAGRLVLSGRGEDIDGRGRVQADVALKLTRLSPSQTRCAVLSDLDVTGDAVRLGRAAVESAVRQLTEEVALRLTDALEDKPMGGHEPYDTAGGRSPKSVCLRRVGPPKPFWLALTCGAGAAVLLAVLSRRCRARST